MGIKKVECNHHWQKQGFIKINNGNIKDIWKCSKCKKEKLK